MLSAIVNECVFAQLTLIENNSTGIPMIMEVVLKRVHRIKNTISGNRLAEVFHEEQPKTNKNRSKNGPDLIS